MKKRILCIIPARKGSKGLKNKNYLFFDKKRLIYYPVSKATQINLIDKIIFTSDSKEYIKYIKSSFPNVHTDLRPKKLSIDTAKTFDVIKDVISKLKKNKENYDIIILLEPTSPLTPVSIIKKALINLINNYNKFDAIIPLVNLPKFNKIFSIKLKNSFFFGKKFPNNLRRQNLDTFFLSGNFYISKVSSYFKNKGFYSNKTSAIIINKKYYSDIDDIFEFKDAEFKKKKLNL